MIYTILFFYEAIICCFADKFRLKNLNGVEISNNKLHLFPNKIVISILVILPMILVMGLRYQIGKDYANYEFIFYRIKNYSDAYGMEIAYYLINSAIGRLTDNPQWVFFVISILINILFVKGMVKNGGSLYYGILAFMGLGYWFYAMNIQRQYVACAIIFIGWKHLEHRELKKFLPYIIIAMTFHNSAIIVLPLYFLLNYVNGKRFYYSTFVVIAVTTILRGSIFVLLQKIGFYGVYLEGSYLNNSPSVVNIIIAGIFMIATTIFYKKLVQIKKENEIRVKVIWLLLLVNLFLWTFGDVALRMLVYLNPISLLLIQDIIHCFSPKMRQVMKIGVGVLCWCFMMIIITYSGNASQHFLPYRYRTLWI